MNVQSGDLLREEDVLEWLVANKNTASEEEDMIEDITAKTLEAMTNTVAHLAVLFCKYNCNSRVQLSIERSRVQY